MKTFKRFAALLLSMCVLVGIPLSVSAATASDTLALDSIILHTENRLKLTFNEELRSGTDGSYLSNLNNREKLEMGLAWVKDEYTGTEGFEKAIVGDRIPGTVVYGSTYDVLIWSPDDSNKMILELLTETKSGCTLKFYFFDNGCNWNGAGCIGAVQDISGDGLPCPSLGFNSETLSHCYEYLFEDIDLHLIDAKFIGVDRVLFTFNKPITYSTEHYVGISLYNSNNKMMGYKRNDETGAYEFDVAETIISQGGKRAQWGCSGEWIPFDESGKQYVTTINGGVTGEDIRKIVENSGGDLRFRIQENANYAPQSGRVNTIHAVANENDCLVATQPGSQDQAWISVAEWDGNVARIGTATYQTLNDALNAAESGDTVELTYFAVSEDYSIISADVTLDLNGYWVFAEILIAFGNVVDSTQGEGALINSRNQESSCIHLRSDNPTFPLYDANIGGYRFFAYSFSTAGTKAGVEDTDKVTYGIKLKFDSLRAYELLADEANADVSLVMNLAIGYNKFEYKFSHTIFDLLYQTMKSIDFSRRDKYAILLTISGLDKLSANDAIVATPTIYSAQRVSGSGVTISYEGEYDSYSRAKAWIEEQIEQDTLFSFTYDGVAYTEHMNENNWTKNVTNTNTGWIVRYTHKEDNVVAWSEITLDPQTASVEWTNYFKNNGTSDSPIISDIRAMSSSILVEDPVLTVALGSNNSYLDFQSGSFELPQGEVQTMYSEGGRSSQTFLPYFDICNGEYGIMGGIGWTGDWSANFVNNNGVVTIDSGMQETYISLHAGEDMRTPMMMIQFFKGDQDSGHNALRQLILKSYTPADANGKTIEHGMLSFGVSNVASQQDDPERAMMNQTKWIDQRYECLWIDTGWYGKCGQSGVTWTTQAGNWYFSNRYKDNNGNGTADIGKLSEQLQKQGKDLLLWFEPERVRYNTELYRNCSDYLLKDRSDSEIRREGIDKYTFLFDFSNDDACDYMIDKISDIIQENGVTWYRQDFNMDPASYWSYNDEANRKGMTEIKYITNLYRYLDALIHEGIMIDSCASGGRRLDLEMMKRSLPLWNSDYVTEEGSTYDKVRSINYNLSWWLPIHAGGWPWKDYEKSEQGIQDLTYAFRVDMNSGMQLGYNILKDSEIQKLLDQYFVCRELMNGDYYILATGAYDGVGIKDACYEFYKQEKEKGYLVAFRPKNCPTESATYKLKGLNAKATYELEFVDTGETRIMTGEQLMTEGLTVTYSVAKQALLIYVNKI